jgi:O-antigen/teichoic acid export membrane protein
MSLEIAKNISKNVTVLAGTRVITYISGFVLIIFLPRYLGAEDYGKLFLGISIVSMASIFIDFGGRYLITKEISRSKENAAATIITSITNRIFLWFISIIGVMIFAFIAQYPFDVKIVILVLSVGTLWEGTRGVLWCAFQGFEMMEYPSNASIIESMFKTIVCVVALILGANVIVIAILYITSSFLNTAILIKFSRRFILSFPRVELKTCFSFLRNGIPYFLWSIFGVVYYRIDSVMLSLMTPGKVVGWYGVAYNFFDILMFVPNILSIAIFPVFARLWKKDDSSLLRTTHKSLEYIIMVGVPISVVTFAFAEQIIQILFGLEQYAASVFLLKIFGLGVLLVYVDWIIGTTLLAFDKQRQWSLIALLACCVNIALNYFLIPYTQHHQMNGGIGAAIATIMTEYFVLISALFLLPKGFFNTFKIDAQLKSLAAGVLMGFTIWVSDVINIYWAFNLVISLLIYICTLFLLKTLRTDEINFIKSAFSLTSIKNSFTINQDREL